MSRILFASLTLFVAFLFCDTLSAARNELIPETTAAQHGLARPWFTQVELDRGRGRLCDLVLHRGILYAQTDNAVIHAIDAETGRTLWWKRVGLPSHPSMTPGLNHKRLAVINGSRVYVLDRLNGDLLYEKEVQGAPGAGAALSTQRVYIPMTTGMILAYRLDPLDEDSDGSEKVEEQSALATGAPFELDQEEDLRIEQKSVPPLFCQSYGKALVQPLVTRENAQEECVVWPTDRGILNFGRIDRTKEDHLTIMYRLETGAEIVGRPAFVSPDPEVADDSGLILTASRDGFVYAVRETTGKRVWRFSVGEPIIESPAVIADRVYVTAQLGGMYCLEAKTGKSLWFAPNMVQFVAASKARVYATDRIGRLIVLDARSGAPLDAIATENIPIKLLNTETDRIYLADDRGLIQCLREIELSEPIAHVVDRKPAEPAAEKPAAE